MNGVRGQGIDNVAWLKQFQKDSSWASALFGAALIAILLLMFWLVPHPSDFQRQLAHWVVAICSAFLATFFLGGIILHGSVRGLKISAGGGFALFVFLMLAVDPFPKGSPPPGQPAWDGGSTLGSLIDTLNDAYAAGQVTERIQVDAEHREEIYDFNPGPTQWTGRTWIELFQKIAGATGNSCLQVVPFPDGKTLRLTIVGQTERRCVGKKCWYACSK